MRLALVLAFQAAAEPPPSPATIPSDFDLAKIRPSAERPSPGCAMQDQNEIVVCARRPGHGDYPFEKMARIYDTKPLVAEADIGHGAKARAYAESVKMPGGQVSKRAMVGIKLPF